MDWGAPSVPNAWDSLAHYYLVPQPNCIEGRREKMARYVLRVHQEKVNAWEQRPDLEPGVVATMTKAIKRWCAQRGAVAGPASLRVVMRDEQPHLVADAWAYVDIAPEHRAEVEEYLDTRDARLAVALEVRRQQQDAERVASDARRAEQAARDAEFDAVRCEATMVSYGSRCDVKGSPRLDANGKPLGRYCIRHFRDLHPTIAPPKPPSQIKPGMCACGYGRRSKDWLHCPKCGAELPAIPEPRPEGICNICDEPVEYRWSMLCERHKDERIVKRCLRDHTVADIGALFVQGKTWREVAQAIGYPQPQRGPKDVEFGLSCAYPLVEGHHLVMVPYADPWDWGHNWHRTVNGKAYEAERRERLRLWAMEQAQRGAA